MSTSVTFEMFFLILSNVEINITNYEFNMWLYTTATGLLITKQVKLFAKKEFAIAAFDLENEIFVVFMAFLIIFDKVYLS